MTQYNPQTGKGGLFCKHINAFLKVKQESLGWPEWCKTEEDRDNYLSSYKTREGISLDRDNVKKNPSFRSLAKLCLNRYFFDEKMSSIFSYFFNHSSSILNLLFFCISAFGGNLVREKNSGRRK